MTDLERNVLWGEAAIRAGAPDVAINDAETNAADALCSIMHACDTSGVQFDAALSRAREYRLANLGE